MKTRIVTAAGFIETNDPVHKSSFHGIEVLVCLNPKGSMHEGTTTYVPLSHVLTIHVTPDDTPKTLIT